MSGPKPCLGHPSRTAAIAAMQADGLSNATIADRIGIAVRTVTALKGAAERTARRLTPEQIEEIIELREHGRGYEWIGKRMGVSAGAIHYQCLKHGATSPRQRRHPVPTEPIVRNGKRPQRLFTQDEDRQLVDLSRQGRTYTQIARAMNRPYTSVRIRLLTLALNEDIPLADDAA